MLGHEIGHVTARHSAQQYTRAVGGQIGLVALGVFVPAARPFGEASQQAMGLLFLKFGRDDELQSDQLGAGYAAAGGWDPAGVPGMLSTLGRLAEASGDRKGVPNFLSTHPEPLARVMEIAPTVAKLKAAGGPSSPLVRRCAAGCRRRSTATTRSRASSEAPRSCIRRCAFVWTFRASGPPPTVRAGDGAGAQGRRLPAAPAGAAAAGRLHAGRRRRQHAAGRAAACARRAHDDRRVRRLRRHLPGADRGTGPGGQPRRAHPLRRQCLRDCRAGTSGGLRRTRGAFDAHDSQLPLAVGGRGGGDQAGARSSCTTRASGDTWAVAGEPLGRRHHGRGAGGDEPHRCRRRATCGRRGSRLWWPADGPRQEAPRSIGRGRSPWSAPCCSAWSSPST